MSQMSDFPAVGRILSNGDGVAIFQPPGTSYELRLAADKVQAPAGQRIACLIRAAGRKLWTVSGGGNFIVPISGPPRIVQGRIKYLDETHMVVQAGAPVVVELPKDDSAYDLARGPLRVGALVNATLMPGARMELLTASAIQ